MRRGIQALIAMLVVEAATICAIVLGSDNIYVVIPGTVIYASLILSTVHYINRYISREESPAVLLLSTLATSLGALVGLLLSSTLHAALVATGIVLASTIYGILALTLKGISRGTPL